MAAESVAIASPSTGSVPALAKAAEPLAGLKDLALPAPPPWLPPQGPGWTLLALLLAGLLAWTAWRLWQGYRRNRYRREALAALAFLAPRLAAPGTLAEVSALLKRTALVAFAREAVAPLTGADWRRFLCASGGPAFADPDCDPLFTSAYAPDCTASAGQRAALIAATRQWLRRHRRPVDTPRP